MKKRFHFPLSYAISLQKTRFNAIGNPTTGIREKANIMANLGYNGIELAVRNPAELDYGDLDSALKESSLRVTAIGTGQAFLEEGLSLTQPDKSLRDAAISRLKTHIDLANRYNSHVIIGLIRGKDFRQDKKDHSLEILQTSLIDCLDYAGKKRVHLIIEPINRYECGLLNSIAETIAFVQTINDPNLKILADTFHMNIEEPTFRDSLLQCAPYLSHVHIADSNRLFPGAGHINFFEILSILEEIGYSGYISGEMIPKPSEEDAMRQFIRFMQTMQKSG
jgi:sugar phosphate isomerase/epimerase